MEKMIEYHKRPDGMYECDKDYHYFSHRYYKRVFIKKGTLSDGATGALDIHSAAWWVHDELCKTARWADLSPARPWQCACVLGDVLRQEGRYLRSIYWKYFTYLFGCKKPWTHVLTK